MRCSRLLFVLLTFLLFVAEGQAQSSESVIEDGYLYVPRIDVDGYGALALSFRIVYQNGAYYLDLESADPAALTVRNSGVFNPDLMTLEIDSIVLENGASYAATLALMEEGEQSLFEIRDAIELGSGQGSENPPPASGGSYSDADKAAYDLQCAGCHGVDGAGSEVGPALAACANCATASGLANYIRDTMPIGQPGSCDINCASQMATYILAAFNAGNEELANDTVGFIRLLSAGQTLRKAAMELNSRIPTPAEYQAVASGGDSVLRDVIDGMLEEQAFHDRLMEIWNDYLLTDKYHSRNGSEAAIRLLSNDDFPDRRWFDPGSENRDDHYEAVRRATNNGIAREPLALISHVVRNELPFTEILTADYMMVNGFSARSYGIEGLAFTNPDDPDEYRPGRLQGVPHAGILTSPMFLNRYPTTSTNRNRGRARVVFDLFLDTDILAIEGVRPGNAVDITTPIPTINNPQCSKCHSILDPVASTFQNWDYKGRYRPARESKYGWYTDMEARGFNGELMPLQGNVDSSLQWLAAQVAGDPKFPRAVTRIMVNGLTGKEPLKAPAEGASQEAVDAYIAERTVLNDIQTSFINANYNLKVLVREIMLSPYWRAGGLTEDANRSSHELTGASYLLSPEQLDRKIRSLLGFEWRNSMDSYYKDQHSSWASKLGNTFHQIYGGIDSDSVTTRLRSPNGMMGAMQLRMANELACYAVPHDFWLPADQRRLFRHVSADSNPYNNTGRIDSAVMALVRQNIQYLHHYLLAEDLPINHPEILITEQLFMDVLDQGRQIILNGGGHWSDGRLHSSCDRTRDLQGRELSEDARLRDDHQYVVRAWMAVVAYLLADYRFVYN